MSVVYLVRHGRTALNAEGRLRGRLDPPLDDVGIREVAALGAAFGRLPSRPYRVVAGPLTRTRQTAQAVADACGLDVAVDERLVDRDYGPWTGEYAAEVRARWGQDLADLPEAEPLDALVARARSVLDDQRDRSAQGPVVLVSHDVVNAHLLHSLDPTLGRPHEIHQSTACWNALSYADGRWRVRAVDGDADTLV